ncbi:MAG TPA: ABC transporter ATP-binding protein [Vicinamibacterales bacterium]|nr:ABC transporter ATP-binding protein [Vicinamibacterales bacterium]
MHTTCVAEVRSATRTYRSGAALVPALRGASLRVSRGELVALSGPSGSGKSTLLHLIGCLDRPDSGEVRLGDLHVSAMSSAALAAVRRDRLGFVFQSFNLVPVLTAFENVEYPLLLTPTPAAERRRRVNALLDCVGLAGKGDRRPHELSGGERQRVAIARALVNGPQLVLADEPTASLDSATGAAVLDVMEDLRERFGTAFLFASHDPRLVERMDRVITMKDGVTCD